MKKCEKIKNSKGITLITLVITVVVMLMLAGVAISAIVGEEGLFSKIGNARNVYEEAIAEEGNLLISISDQLEDEMYGKVEKVNDIAPGILEGEGTETNPFFINSIEDLVAFSEDVKNGMTYENQYVSLGLSLNFNSTKSYVDYTRKDFMGYSGELRKALTTENGFKGIGMNTADDADGINSFKGNFDGNNNKIINLYMNINNGEEWTRAGLFGNNCGIINNLELVNVNITGITTGANSVQCGGIVGHNWGEINNCITRGKIYGTPQGTGGAYIGGICAYNDGTIDNCVNYSKLDVESNSIGNANIAGISGGANINGIIKNSQNYGKIELKNRKAEYFSIGGIVGYGKSLVENSVNYADIYVKELSAEKIISMAGIIGAATNDLTYEISENCNKGNITCLNSNSEELYVGGIAGKSNIIKNCYNSGNIECANNNLNSNLLVGGIAGMLQKNHSCKNLYNIGSIDIQSNCEQKLYIGGIIGRNEGPIDKCYNFSEKIKVTSLGENYVGGIVGRNENNITNSYNKSRNLENVGIVSNGENAIRNCAGGIAGYNTSVSSISTSANDVKVLAESGRLNYMGGICGYNGGSDAGFGKINDCKYRIYNDLVYNAAGAGTISGNVEASENYIVAEKIIEVINGDNMFKEDTNNINNGYPILIW